MMAMHARTILSLSWSPSFPTAISELATELGNKEAFTVIICNREESEDKSFTLKILFYSDGDSSGTKFL